MYQSLTILLKNEAIKRGFIFSLTLGGKKENVWHQINLTLSPSLSFKAILRCERRAHGRRATPFGKMPFCFDAIEQKLSHLRIKKGPEGIISSDSSV